MLAVTTTPLAWEGTTAVIGGAPGIRIGLGLHPELVSERAGDVARFDELLPEADLVGEIGLDGSRRHRASLPLQREVFQSILTSVSRVGGRVMSIHSRGAAKETLDMLEEYGGASTPVLHWFSGSQRELQRAIDAGCWFSVGPAMLKGAKGRRLAEMMPVNRVLTETDGPFTRNGKMPLFPWDTDIAERALGGIWRMEAPEARLQLRANLDSLLGKSVA